MEKQKFDEEVKDRVKSMVSDRNGFYSRDVGDLDSARAALSGFGFDEKDREYRGELKPEITIPILDEWINATVSSYTASPFGLGLKAPSGKDISQLRMVFDKVQQENSLTDLVSTGLNKALGVGYSYLLVSSEIVDNELGLQDVIIREIDSRKVICDASEDPELDDCEMVVVVDVLKKDIAAKKYKLEKSQLISSQDSMYGIDIVLDSNTQCSVLTVYEKVQNGVIISKVVGNFVVAQATLALSRIPITRIYCDETYIEKELHYRGVYNKIAGLWKLANYGISEVQNRIATAPAANFIVDPTSIAQNSEDWESGSDSSVLGANSWDGSRELRAPQQVSKALALEEPLGVVSASSALIKEALGRPSGEGKQNETAEAVLARKATAEASVSKYLSNLKKSMKALGRSILDYIAICYDVPRDMDGVVIDAITVSGVVVTVDGGPTQATQREKSLQQVLLVGKMAAEGGNAQAMAKIAPIAITMSDMEPDIKQALMMAIGPQQPNALPPEVQQQMQAAQAQLAEKDKSIAQLQQALFEMQTDSKASLLKAQMDNASRERIEVMKLQAQGAQLDKELMAKTEMQTRELYADYMQAKEKAAEEAAKVQTPLFTNARVIG